jgi:hypothetical protein
MGERRNAYNTLVGKQKGKKPLGRPRCGHKDNIKIGGASQFVLFTEYN